MAESTPGLSDLLTMGLVCAGSIAIGLLAGLGIDAAAHTTPVFVLIGLAVGLLGAGGYLVSRVRTTLHDTHIDPATIRPVKDDDDWN